VEFEGQARINNQLNIAPLVDVVFLLLIFFMLTSTMMTQQGIELSLPGAEHTTTIQGAPFEVSVSNSGEIFIGSEVVSSSQLRAAVQSHLASGESDQVILRSDGSVSVDQLVSVMDQLKSAGATNISLATKRKAIE